MRSFEILPKHYGAALYKSSVGSLPRLKLSFFLLSACTNQLKSAANIITFLLNFLPLP